MQGSAIIIARAPGESRLSPFGGDGAWCITTTGGITTVLCEAGGGGVFGIKLLGGPAASACIAWHWRRWLMACCSCSRCSCSLTAASLLRVPLYAPQTAHAVRHAALRSVQVAHAHSSLFASPLLSITPLGRFEGGWGAVCGGCPPNAAGEGGGG
jgi:hypothetical protein